MEVDTSVAWGVVICFQLTAASAANGDVRLVEAAKRNDVQSVRSLIAKHVDVNARHADGSTPLLWVAYHADLDTARLLLRAGADPDAANSYGESPLSLACEMGNQSLVDTLLEAGADATATKPTGETMLMIAARQGDVAVVKQLIDYGADVNGYESTQRQTALMWAAAHKRAKVVSALLAADADPNMASASGSTALHFAVQQADLEVARQLLAAGAGVDARMSVRLIDGFTTGLVETLRNLTPLLLAITDCRRDGVEFNGTQVDHPLWESCSASEELGGLLLDYGADANATDDSQIPALIQAVHARMLNLVKMLVSHGANVNARVPPSARQWTGKNRGGARVISQIPVGATPFFVAAWWHNPEMIQTLLALNADPQLAAQDGTTPLMGASGVVSRPPMGLTNMQVDTPRMLETVRLCIEHGNVNSTNASGQTAMHGAVQVGWPELIEYLAANGARLDVVDSNGNTPLMLAKEKKRIVEVLSKLGAR